MTKRRNLNRYFHGGPHDSLLENNNPNAARNSIGHSRQESYLIPNNLGGSQYYGPPSPPQQNNVNNTIGSLNTFTAANTTKAQGPQGPMKKKAPNVNNTVINNTNTNTKAKDPNVLNQQNILISQGYALPKFGADGYDGPETQAALNQRGLDKKAAAENYGVYFEDIVYSENGWEPRPGAINNDGQSWGGDKGWLEKEVEKKEKPTVDSFTDVPNVTQKETEKETEEEKKLYEKLGINGNTAMNLINGLSIIKANRQANNANKKIGELQVNSDRLQPQTYNPELVDLSQAKKDSKEIATAAIRRSQESGNSVAETRALLTGASANQEKIAKTESELQKQELNTAKKANIEERSRVEQFNITNERKDQITNNDTKASMYKNSIAITNQMRDAIATTIKDVKMYDAAIYSADVVAKALSGASGLYDRKYKQELANLVGNGSLTQSSADIINKSIEDLNTPEKKADGGFWQRRKMNRQNRN